MALKKKRSILLSAAIIATTAALAPSGVAHASEHRAPGATGAPARTVQVTWRLRGGLARYIGDYLEIYRAGRRNGNWADLGRGNRSRNQKWYSIDLGIGGGQNRTEYAFKNLNSGLCLEARGTFGTHAVQWACGRYPDNARWWEWATHGGYELQNVYYWTVTGSGGYMCEGFGPRWNPEFVYFFSTIESGSCVWY